jgi:hypothetical protein
MGISRVKGMSTLAACRLFVDKLDVRGFAYDLAPQMNDQFKSRMSRMTTSA